MTTTAKKEHKAESKAESERRPDHLAMTAQIVSAFVSNNQVMRQDMPALLRSVHGTLTTMNGEEYTAPSERKPAVPVKKSVTDEYLVCLEDGAKLTMLKRYLRTHYNMTPEDYRKKWDLPLEYPMVAPAYARLRSAFAKKIGLGRVPTRAKKK